MFCIECMLPRGNSVILPGSSVVLTTEAPFSWSITVSVVPSTATTTLSARGCRCGGSMLHGASRMYAMVMPRPVMVGNVAALALMTPPGQALKKSLWARKSKIQFVLLPLLPDSCPDGESSSARSRSVGLRRSCLIISGSTARSTARTGLVRIETVDVRRISAYTDGMARAFIEDKVALVSAASRSVSHLTVQHCIDRWASYSWAR